MEYYYRITAVEDEESVTYTKSQVSVEQIKDLMYKNGYTPKVQKLTKLQIPLSEIDIVNELNENKNE
jgi:hypothetical protein